MFKIFKRLTAKELSMIVLAVIFVCLNVYLNLKIPDYMSDIITLLSTKGTKASDIFAWNTDAPGMRMLLMSFVGFMASVVVSFLAARTASSFTTRLRDDIFHQVLDFSDAEIKKFSIPSLLTRTTNDITQLQMALTMGLQVITQGPIMAIWAITKIADKNGNWLLALLVAVAVIAILMLFLLIMVMPKQRLAIARALARKPEILIFDDSFSALDYKTDRKLRQELSEKTQDMTKLIVAQRISTIMNADQILVLDQGKVVGQGTHRELLANNEVYQEIAYSQLSKEELENGK